MAIHPSHPPPNDIDIVVLKSLVYSVPDQATPNDDSSQCRIVCDLRKPSGINKDALR